MSQTADRFRAAKWCIAFHIAFDAALVLLPLRLPDVLYSLVFASLVSQASLLVIVPRLAGCGPAVTATVGLLGTVATTSVWARSTLAPAEDVWWIMSLGLAQLALLLALSPVAFQSTVVRSTRRAWGIHSLLVWTGLAAAVLTMMRTMARRWSLSIDVSDVPAIMFCLLHGCFNAVIALLATRWIGSVWGISKLRWSMLLAGVLVICPIVLDLIFSENFGNGAVEFAIFLGGQAAVVIATLACLPRRWVQASPPVLNCAA